MWQVSESCEACNPYFPESWFLSLCSNDPTRLSHSLVTLSLTCHVTSEWELRFLQSLCSGELVSIPVFHWPNKTLSPTCHSLTHLSCDKWVRVAMLAIPNFQRVSFYPCVPVVSNVGGDASPQSFEKGDGISVIHPKFQLVKGLNFWLVKCLRVFVIHVD